MPIIRESDYKPPLFLKNSHLQSIYHKYFRPAIQLDYQRERLTLSDGDFVDVDWLKSNNPQLVMLLHGLEGSSDSHYIKGMAKLLKKNNYDVLAMNFRGCSGEPNLKFRAYHSGDWQDVDEVIKQVVKTNKYKSISLVGFSLGGNVVLRYAGLKNYALPPIIDKIVGISVPCDLKASAYHLARKSNRIYLRRFIKSMADKLKYKTEKYPNELLPIKINTLTDFKLFDDYYTAPAHGFPDAHTYWETCSSVNVITKITVPTYILTAKDDQFLTSSCFPIEAARNKGNILLEIPEYGGHVGFVTFNKENEYWHETKILSFLQKK